MQVKMRIKGLKTNETSFKNAQDENQTEDTGQNLEYDRCDFLVFNNRAKFESIGKTAVFHL